MSRVRSENTKPEVFAFRVVDKLKIKYEKHFKIPGKPDLAFLEKKVAVFINGEFWHGRRFGKEKATYKDFWVKKIQSNMIRDKKNNKLLINEGWIVIKIWDKDLNKHPVRELNKIMRALGYNLIRKTDLEI